MSATTTTINNNNNNNVLTTYFNYANDQKYYQRLEKHRYSIDDSQLTTMPGIMTTSTPATNTKMNYQLIKSNSYSGNAAVIDNKPLMRYNNEFSTQTAAAGTPAQSNSQSNTSSYSSNSPTAASSGLVSSAGVNDSALNLNDDTTEYDAFLLQSSSGNRDASTSRRTRSYTSKSRSSCCLHSFITRNWYLTYLLPISVLVALLVVAYLTRDYAKQLLFWIETQNPWIIFVVFMLLFTVVSFPIVVGYFVLLITAGYLFGCFRGWFTAIIGANLGIAIAHWTIRSLRHRIPIQKLIKNETGRAILRVISGPRAFKVVLFTRLTPIPFGLQNAIFGISSINLRDYHLATFIGLLPAQTINVYLGSTLRSMHEVLNNDDTKLTGYISFIFEVICGIGLMFWVVQKARKELAETLLTDISTEGKPIDMQV